MEIPPEPKSADDNSYEYLIDLVGKNGIAFLNLDNAITAVKQKQRVWQAPFAIGLRILPFLYNWEKDNKETPISAFIVSVLASQIHAQSGEKTVLDLTGSTLESLEWLYKQMSTEVSGYQLTETDAHMLFHTRFALGVLLLLKGDEERARIIIREMFETKTALSSPTTSSGWGLGYRDVAETKDLAAIILLDYFVNRQDYAMALDLLIKAVASLGPGYFSENLMTIVPGLIESFVEKCEQINDVGDWVELFDQVAGVVNICGEADTSGDLPSTCKKTSPQFMAWKLGQLVSRYAIRNRGLLSNDKKIVPDGYRDHGIVENSTLGIEFGGYGDDWLNGTMVASLLLGHNEHCNWRLLHKQYVSMWEALPRYHGLSLSEAGTETDLYWATRLGFVDKMLETTEQEVLLPAESEPSSIVRDIGMTRDIASTIALRQIKEQQNVDKILDSVQKLIERQPPSKTELVQQLQQRLNSVWNKLPATVIDNLITAENDYRTGVKNNEAKGWFHKAVEASLDCCFVEPLANFIQKRGEKSIAISFPSPRGIEHKNSGALRNLSLWEWSDVFDVLSITVDRSLTSLGAEDLKQFIKQHWGELPLPALRELSRSLRDFCQYRRDSQHHHIPRYEREIQELEKMRELALGIKRPSVIAQIFQLFNAES